MLCRAIDGLELGSWMQSTIDVKATALCYYHLHHIVTIVSCGAFSEYHMCIMHLTLKYWLGLLVDKIVAP